MLGLTAAYALFWTLCVQRVNPFLPLPVRRGRGTGDGQYGETMREMTPDVLHHGFRKRNEHGVT